MTLIDDEPPSTLPRIASMRRPLRLGSGSVSIAPVVHRVLVHLADAERDVDQRMRVAAARLEQQHARGAVLAQPVGQHAARRAGADDDVVVASVTRNSLLKPSRRRNWLLPPRAGWGEGSVFRKPVTPSPQPSPKWERERTEFAALVSTPQRT